MEGNGASFDHHFNDFLFVFPDCFPKLVHFRMIVDGSFVPGVPVASDCRKRVDFVFVSHSYYLIVHHCSAIALAIHGNVLLLHFAFVHAYHFELLTLPSAL